MSSGFREINHKPIFWQRGDTIHAVEGADVHPDIRLLWTLCEIDVPAGEAFISRDAKITCEKCAARKETQDGTV